jgi:hypothetical protein
LDDPECAKAGDYLSEIRPPKVGSKGQILEWRTEYREAEPGHRHLSPIWGLFPGRQMTPRASKEFAAASKVLLDERIRRGAGSTGWSRAWVINLYARLLQGDTAWSHAVAFLQKYPTNNLWNTDNGPGTAFQIDGNYGFTAGVAEMLLQSHDGVVSLLPDLPAAVPAGSVDGLVARGNFVVGMEWSDGALVNATITSLSGRRLELEAPSGTSLTVNDLPYAGPINTTVGGVYEIKYQNK